MTEFEPTQIKHIIYSMLWTNLWLFLVCYSKVFSIPYVLHILSSAGADLESSYQLFPVWIGTITPSPLAGAGSCSIIFTFPYWGRKIFYDLIFLSLGEVIFVLVALLGCVIKITWIKRDVITCNTTMRFSNRDFRVLCVIYPLPFWWAAIFACSFF